MPEFQLEKIVRKNILGLKPYRCARDDFKEGILLDANENAFGTCLDDVPLNANLNRYPDPHQLHLKASLLKLYPPVKGVENVFVGVGSDEVIDLVLRIFCRPGIDKIIITPPTYGMYKVSAQINDVGVVESNLLPGGFQIDMPDIKEKISSFGEQIKVIFLCSPGNPTGTSLEISSMVELLEFGEFKGIVVVDEAYMDFAEPGLSAVQLLSNYPNLIIMKTLSKSFGLAGIRLGVAFSSQEIIRLINNTKAPYNISSLTSQAALKALTEDSVARFHVMLHKIKHERQNLKVELSKLHGLGKPLGGSEANFLLIPVLGYTTSKPSNLRAKEVYLHLAKQLKVVVRYRAEEVHCEGCLRITVGTPEENAALTKGLALSLERYPID